MTVVRFRHVLLVVELLCVFVCALAMLAALFHHVVSPSEVARCDLVGPAWMLLIAQWLRPLAALTCLCAGGALLLTLRGLCRPQLPGAPSPPAAWPRRG